LLAKREKKTGLGYPPKSLELRSLSEREIVSHRKIPFRFSDKALEFLFGGEVQLVRGRTGVVVQKGKISNDNGRFLRTLGRTADLAAIGRGLIRAFQA